MTYKDVEAASHHYRSANEIAKAIDAARFVPKELEIGEIVSFQFITEQQIALAAMATNSQLPPQKIINEIITPRLYESVGQNLTRLERELQKPAEKRRFWDEESYVNYYLHGVVLETAKKAHGSVWDKVKVEFWFENIPRLATLLHARASRGLDLLQQTSRGQFLAGMHVPDCVKKSGIFYLKAQKAMANTWKTYLKFLQDDEKPQFAMYVMPLFAMTNNTVSFSGRGIVDNFLSSTGGYGPEAYAKIPGEKIQRPKILQDLALRILSETQKRYPTILGDHAVSGVSKNYEPLRVFQGGSADFLEAENKPLERIIADETLAPLKNRVMDVLVLSTSGEKYITEGEVEQALRDRDNSYLAFLEAEVQHEVVFRIPISDYHDWWRHRTVLRSHRPFKKILDEVVAAGQKGHDYSILYAAPPFQKEKNLQLYEEAMAGQLDLCAGLLEENIPWFETIGYLPHAMLNYEAQRFGGWNLLYLSADRLCISARPSIQKTMQQLKEQLAGRGSPLAKFMHPHGYFSQCTIADEWGCTRYCKTVSIPTSKGIPEMEIQAS